MKRILHFVAMLFISFNLFSQAPQKMSYQAVIRNASNALVSNAPVKMRISILQGSATGNAVYSELHSATTNVNGLVSIEIGAGTSPQGTFSSINWGNGTYFLKTETDPTNGTNYSIVGTSQLLSVPYALQANNAGNGIKDISKTGDTVYLDNGKKYIIPGIKDLNPSSTINSGLVGFWPFNGNANDESGNGKNGTVNGATLTNDRFGNNNRSYNFNGVNNYITVSNFSVNFSSFTLSFWTRFNNNNIIQRIISQKWDCDNNIGALGTHISDDPTDNKIKFGISIRSTVNVENKIWDNSLPSLNQWINYTITFSNNKLTIYKNGILNSVAQTNSGLKQVTNNLYFGGDECGYPFFGVLDDIRIYNRALTQEEITYLANN
jgi:hypothetical protein